MFVFYVRKAAYNFNFVTAIYFSINRNFQFPLILIENFKEK